MGTGVFKQKAGAESKSKNVTLLTQIFARWCQI